MRTKVRFPIIIILTVLPWSLFAVQNDVVCQLFDVKTKTVEKYCKSYRVELPKSCSTRVTITLPSINDNQIDHMKIGGCNSTTILDAIQTYQSIGWLDLSFSDYKTLDWLNVKMERLKNFNASFNLLSEMPWNLFKSAPELTELDLSYNKIAHLNETHLSDASNLRKIHLNHNQLDKINGTYFHSASNLEYIDLRENFLTEIPLFSDNKNLKVVRFQENPIQQFNCSFLLSSHSISFQLSWSHVRSFNGNENCTGKRIHVISSNSSDGGNNADNNDGISTDINTRRHTLSCRSKSFISLHNFVAGRNAFDNVVRILNCFDDIHYIDLSGNFIGALPEAAFESFYFLERLNLSGTLLSYFDVGALQSPSQLKSLDLSHNNNLRDVRNISLANYINELIIIDSNLQNTPEIVQNLAATILRLDLSGSFMGNINGMTFRRFLALHSLRLSNTSLSINQGGDPFERLVELRSLDVSHNNLTNLNLTQFSKTLNRLVEFRAANCHIANVSELFEHLADELRILDISGNSVGYLDNRHIERFTSLEELRLRNTELFHFDASSLQNLRKLTALDISQNQLKTLDLHPLPKTLEYLNLQSNELRLIGGLKQSKFVNLTTLAISNNQLECDQLQQILSDTNGIRFVDNPLNQKPRQNCDANDDYQNILIILVVSVILIIVLCIACVLIRILLVKPLQTVYTEK